MTRHASAAPSGGGRIVRWLVAAFAALAACDSPTDPNAISHVTIAPGTVALETLGDTVRLVAVAHTVGQNQLTGRVFSWASSATNVAFVDGEGLVTAVGNGAATIQATIDGVVGSTTLSVAQRAASVTASPAAPDTLVSLGETVQLTAAATDAGDNLLAAPVLHWSSSAPEVVTVSEAGLAVAMGNGVADLTVTVHEAADTVRVIVRQRAAALAFLTQPERALAGSALDPGIVIELRDALGTRVDFADDVITLTLEANPGATSLSGTTSRAASEGIVTFADLAIDDPAAGYSLKATGSGMEPATSAPFDILIAFSGISAGSVSTCGVGSSGRAYCWGEGSEGRLGTGSEQSRHIPTRVAGGHLFAQVSAGGAHACAVTPSGAAYCWGSNGVEQLGSEGPGSSSPVAVQGGLQFASVQAGSGTSCGITPEGAGYCWGNGISGQLGHGSASLSNTPVPISGDHVWAMLSIGGDHVCGVTTGNGAFCWGDNVHGQLGTGTTQPHSSPAPVDGGLSFVRIAAGGEHTCGVSTDGHVYCWGAGALGQLGDGLSSGSSVPVPVSVPGEAIAVSAGGYESGSPRSCALTTSQEAFCWGTGFLGQPGVQGSSVPIRVETDVSLSAITSGWFHTCAVAMSGEAYCWGGDTSGQLGTGGGTEEVPGSVVAPGS